MRHTTGKELIVDDVTKIFFVTLAIAVGLCMAKKYLDDMKKGDEEE